MKVKDAITCLKGLDPDDEILVDWLNREVFSIQIVVDGKVTRRTPTEAEWQLALKDLDYDDYGLLDDYIIKVMGERLKKVFEEVDNGKETSR